MLRTTFFSTTALVLALAATPAASQVKLKAELECAPKQERLVYDCTLNISDSSSNTMVEGLGLEVKADMPSMPMAHNIPPVVAKPTDKPGVYAFPIKLDMFGNWAFSIRVSGPHEDLLVEVLNFRSDDPDDHGSHKHH